MSQPVLHHVSPNFTTAKTSSGTFDDRVDVYEDRTWGWLLEHAKALATQGPQSTIAALHLAIAFVEPFEVFQSGKSSQGKSMEFFKRGLAKILTVRDPAPTSKQIDDFTTEVYKQLRCGLFHVGLPGMKLVVTSHVKAISFRVNSVSGEVEQIQLNPVSFVDAAIFVFRRYVAQLRDPTDPSYGQLRQNFEAAWKIVHRPA